MGQGSPHERLRLFLALQLPDDVVTRLSEWQSRELRRSLEKRDTEHDRLVPPENLHVTLAFLGSRPARELEAVLGVLAEAARAAAPPVFEPVRYRETRSVGMLQLGDRTGNAALLARRLHEALAALAVYRPEGRAWLPHVTVLRFRERPRLQPSLSELGPFAPSGAAAFLSRLHPSGARTTGSKYVAPEYVLLESFRLGG